MSELLGQALAIKKEIIENRRTVHQFAEIEFDLPQTTAFVMQQLTSYGLHPEIKGKSGVTCTLGQGTKTILLRADMDALPIAETSDLPFAANNGNSHSCGHDTHTAMLLGAAKLLKDREESLPGKVKLMFQPAEEILAGASAMIDDGILENPKVDAALAIHIMTGIEEADSGNIYCKESTIAYSADAIRISVTGLEAHGTMPYKGIDAITIAAHITIALQNIVSKEIAVRDQAVVMVGKITGGTAVNILAGTAVLDVSTRAVSEETRAFLKTRIVEISQNIAKTFRGEAKVEFLYGMPPLVNDTALCGELKAYCTELLGESKVKEMPYFNGSEDFCRISEQIPAMLMTLGVGSVQEGYERGIHHPSMRINEDVLPTGSAVYAHCAVRWLENNC